MENRYKLEDYYPNREKIEIDIDSINIDWTSALLEWDDRLDCQLEGGSVTKEEVENKAKFYKNAFVEGIIRGAQLTDGQAIPFLLQGVFDYSCDTDGGKIPYMDSILVYWDRKLLKENGREPSYEELMAWQTEEVIEQYVKGGFKKFEELEEDLGSFSEKDWKLRSVWQEFLGCSDPDRAAVLAYGTYITIFLYLKDF